MTRPHPKLRTIAVAVYLVATPAAAAEFTHIRKADGSHVVTISGQIRHGDDKKFIQVTSGTVGAVTVILNSPGGYVDEAIAIGRRIRSRNWETRLQNGAVCNSACTLIWLAGSSRHLDFRARLGFHSAGWPPFKRSERGNAAEAAFMARIGVPRQVIQLQPKADPCCLNYIDYAQAQAWGLLSDRSAKQQQALPTPETRQPAAPASPKLMVVRPVTSPEVVEKQFLSPLPSYPVLSRQPASSKPPVRHGWMIQVGAYPGEQAAKERLSIVQSKASKMLIGAQGFTETIEKGGTTYYRACFAGLDRDQAEAACWHLKKNDVECVTVSQEQTEPGTQQGALPTPATQHPMPKQVEPAPQQAAAVGQKVVLYEEDPAHPNGNRFVGSAIWRTESVTPASGQPPELTIHADIEVPERKLAMTWSLRRNTDKGLPATHVAEIVFKLPADFPAGGILNVPGMLMKQAEQTRGVPLAGLAVKVTAGFYLIGLSNLDANKQRNLQLLKERGWLNIPVVYNNNRRAILAIEKGAPGERVFADVFMAWNMMQGRD